MYAAWRRSAELPAGSGAHGPEQLAALFEPLIGLQRDDTLNGLARGFAFRMVEALGILPRADVAQEVKDLDQDARGALRKHGLRFGQFTVFMPLMIPLGSPAGTSISADSS